MRRWSSAIWIAMAVAVMSSCNQKVAIEEEKPAPVLVELQLDAHAPTFAQDALEARRSLIAKGDFATLADLGIEMLKQQGDTREWTRDVGMSYVFLGKPADAKPYLEKSLEMDQTSPDGHGYKALALLEEGNLEDAKGEFRHAVGYAKEQKVELAPIVVGFSMIALDGDREAAKKILENYLLVDVWKRLYDKMTGDE